MPTAPNISTPRFRLRHAALAMLPVLAALSGCQFQQHREELALMAARGETARALATLDDPKVQSLYSEADRLVYDLDRGSLLFYAQRDAEAISQLDRAEATIDRQREPTAADTATKWLLNDAAATYVGEPYEDIYTNVFKLMAYLRQEQLDGRATVEARRILGKTTWLRDRFVASQSETQREAEQRTSGKSIEAPEAIASPTTAGQFIDSPLGTYLTAVTMMKVGEDQVQAVAARRLTDAIQRQQGIIGPVQAEKFAALETLRPADANVLLIGLSGRGPIKFAQRFGPIPLGDIPIYFELPQLRDYQSEADGIRMTLTPVGPTTAAPQEITLSFIEDLGRVATENHRRQMPLIYARTFIRAAVKSAASFAVTESIRKGQGGPRRRSNDEALLSTVVGLAAIAATERADVRCWTFLPGEAYVGLASVPPGTYAVRAEYLRGSQVLYRDDEAQITIRPGDTALSTYISRWWR